MKYIRFAFSFFVIAFILLSANGVYSAEEKQESQKRSHKIFRLNHRPASSVTDIIRIFLSKDGEAIVDERTNALIVIDCPENLSKIEKLLFGVDVLQPQVRIYLKFIGKSTASGLSVYGTITNRANGWVVGLDPSISRIDSSVENVMNLAIVSGSDGFIKMGEKVSYVMWFYNYCLGRRYIMQGVVFQEVSTGFFVSPTVRGNEIEIRIAPGIYYFDGKIRNKIIFREMETTVILKDNQAIILGVGESGEKGSEELISRILGISSFSRDETFNMILTVKVVKGS